MKEVTAYRCDYCRKLYRRRGMCANHEELCLKNPLNIPLCYTCKHFESGFWGEEERISYIDNLGYDDTLHGDFLAMPHRCKLMDVKLYRQCEKMLDNIENALISHDYVPMPTQRDGCRFYVKDKNKQL